MSLTDILLTAIFCGLIASTAHHYVRLRRQNRSIEQQRAFRAHKREVERAARKAL